MMSVGLAFAGGADNAEEITPEAIVKAWQARQEKMRSFRLEWTERLTAV